jgi:hypothetical protein
VRPAAALISTDVKRLIAVCPGDLAGLRDRALFWVSPAPSGVPSWWGSTSPICGLKPRA